MAKAKDKKPQTDSVPADIIQQVEVRVKVLIPVQCLQIGYRSSPLHLLQHDPAATGHQSSSIHAHLPVFQSIRFTVANRRHVRVRHKIAIE